MDDARRFRRPTIPQIRLWSGLALAAYLIGHLTNSALGLISLQTADDARAILHTFWHTPIGMPLLYAALLTHMALGLRALLIRRTLRMPTAEAVQLAFGLIVPALLLAHVAHTRLVGLSSGEDVGYPFVVAQLWVLSPLSGALHMVLLVLVWTHLCIGLNYNLKLRSWYPRAQPLLLAFAILLPTFAALGFVDMGQTIAAMMAENDDWFAALARQRAVPDPTIAWIVANAQWLAPAVMGGLVAIVLIARLARHLIALKRGRITVTYADGRAVRIDRGLSILEASRNNGVPHASFCGGRGRCTTCRVRVDSGADALPAPNAVEARALEQIGEPANVRLACQVRPTEPVSVAPLIAAAREHLVGRGKGGVHGEERPIVIMFIDLRGSTALAEKRLPFDTVFILNQFFSAMTEAVERHGGHYSNFTGDGLMALYGLEDGVAEGARCALRSAFAMLRALAQLNARLKGEIDDPLEIGIGLHLGDAVVGEMGPPKHPVLTALGDPVNTAARLESLTKDNGVPLIVSADAAAAGEIDLSGLPLRETLVKGRAEPVRFYAVPCPPEAL